MKRLLYMAALAALGATAQNHTMFVHHDGRIDPIFYAEIDSMRCSSVALDSTLAVYPVVQEIWTPDSIYRFEIAAIDSITFQNPAPVAAEGVIDLAGDLAPYVIGSEYDAGSGTVILHLLSSTPSALVPPRDSYVFQAGPSEALPAGFAAEILSVSEYDGRINLGGYSRDPEEMFDALVWTVETEFEADPAENGPQRVTPGTLGSDLTYPDLAGGSVSMTDELRDIPAGPEDARIRGSIRVRPLVHCNIGSYVLRCPDGTVMRRRRFFSRVNTTVSATISGRHNVEEPSVVNGRGARLGASVPMGFGNECMLTYTGSMSLRGKMGLDYKLESECRSSALTTITYTQPDPDYKYYDAYSEMKYVHTPMKVVRHTLDASMDGSAALTANITLTVVQNGDSLKSISNTYSYGAELKGSALFLKSEIPAAATDNALYQRLTATGIKATPLERLSASAKYCMSTLRESARLPQSAAATFYAVPRFFSPAYDRSTGTVSYHAEGTPMSFSNARLGAAVQHSDGSLTWTPTDYVWPGNADDGFSAKVEYETVQGESIYPTATLPGGQRILGAPAYPTTGNALLPVTSVIDNGAGIILTGGTPFTGSAVSGNHGVYVGTLIPTN